jgi:hypothetical protein
MLFNNDLLFVVGSVIFIAGGIFTLSKYNIFPTINKGESLINTNSSLDTIGLQATNLSETNNLLTQSYVEASVQTTDILVETGIQTANTYVNTGMQTSARMWLESIRNWITEILGSGTSNPNPQYVDVGVQTNATTMWATVKQWFFEVCSVRSSELTSIGYNKVDKWINNLDSDQSVDLHDSNSPLTIYKFESESELQNLVDPNDSASQINEVVSNQQSNININSSVRVYDMNNVKDVLDLMNDHTVVFSVNSATLPGDDLITFYTTDSANEILRSTLETLLTSVN